ncbi:hypothetical protein GLAREA_09889 [Glarea lozoyensis ATCC 20868]|uniref:Uncharacterized protein n=1 Tax=Glarea lozoyensis (strain ATCC 20868 / MF5171) TaxID=1116229 RepID=S3DQL9_GLAL2|nr:uncharacterized protein GLAREA_09889 [Glarea lozoyensis ATCC 20868]EPE28768.1 hypothetical protein GLAREA_09889 [Glarea lozoyensis ATCC 20868]
MVEQFSPQTSNVSSRNAVSVSSTSHDEETCSRTCFCSMTSTSKSCAKTLVIESIVISSPCVDRVFTTTVLAEVNTTGLNITASTPTVSSSFSQFTATSSSKDSESSSEIKPTAGDDAASTITKETPTYTSPSTTNVATSSSSNKDNTATSSKVDIGIGSAIGGTLIVGVILWLLFRRNRNPMNVRTHEYDNSLEDGSLVEEELPIRGGVITNVDIFLPQPADDNAIVDALSKIRDDIKNHVQNYYHNDDIQAELIDGTEVEELAREISAPPSTVQNLLLNSETRLEAIRLFLAHLILSSWAGQTKYQASLLPREIAFTASSLPAADHTDFAQLALYSKWKTITAALLQGQYGNELGDNDPPNESINLMIATADSVLRPFVGQAESDARQHNLRAIVKRAARFAFLLFS